MERLTREALLSDDRQLEEDDVELPGLGTVRVRALTRAEVLRGQKTHSGTAEIERFMISTGMVDPIMTEDEVAAWQRRAPAGELDPVAYRIQQLSKMDTGADKEQYKSLRDEPGD
jgi:hypothetical protein